MVYVGVGLALPVIDNMDHWVIADTPEIEALKLEQSNHITGRFYQLTDNTLTSQTPPIASDFCKVTYTSGSTGMPKGVCLGQDTLMRIVESLSDALADTLVNDTSNTSQVTDTTSN